MKVLTAILGLLIATTSFADESTPAKIFAEFYGSRALISLVDHELGDCIKVHLPKALIAVYLPHGQYKIITACWQEATPELTAKLHLKPNVIVVCPLSNNFIGTECMYILKDDFVDPASLPPPPKPAFPN